MGMSEREQRQLMQRLATMEKVVDQLLQPKSTARVMVPRGVRIKHVKAPAGGIAAFNTGTATMGSASCTEYTSSSAGVLTVGSSLTCYNAAGAVAANAWGLVAMNEAGLWVWIVELC